MVKWITRCLVLLSFPRCRERPDCNVQRENIRAYENRKSQTINMRRGGSDDLSLHHPPKKPFRGDDNHECDYFIRLTTPEATLGLSDIPKDVLLTHVLSHFQMVDKGGSMENLVRL